MEFLKYKKYRFNQEKDLKLLENPDRQIGFQMVINAIMNGQVLDFKKHHNEKDYPHQYIIYVHLDNRVYSVPCVEESEDSYFLKTIIPDRKARDKYFSKNTQNNKS
jgi:hypothetical protein